MVHAIRLCAIATFVLLLPLSLTAHHGTFYKSVFRAIEKADMGRIEDLFSEAVWEGEEGAMSAAELERRLKVGKLVPRDKSQTLALYENSSRDKDRSRCLVYFKLRYDKEHDKERRDEEIFLLAKRVDFSNNTNRESKAWQIVRIVSDKKEAESFLGRKL